VARHAKSVNFDTKRVNFHAPSLTFQAKSVERQAPGVKFQAQSVKMGQINRWTAAETRLTSNHELSWAEKIQPRTLLATFAQR